MSISKGKVPTDKERVEVLQEGAGILAGALVPHGFKFEMGSSGGGSGGACAQGEFVRGERRRELHLRWSLGLVRYHIGSLSLAHDDYLRALLGRSRAGRYPGTSEEPLAGFEDLRLDLVEHCSDFLSGTGEQFRECVERHRRFELLSPFEKLEYDATRTR